jgi:hypothetical protein
MARSVTEWVTVGGDTAIIACDSGEVWFHNCASGTQRPAYPFATTGPGTRASTIGLLDGAIHLGFCGIKKRLATPEPTRVSYIIALVSAYHTSVHTPSNLRRAAARFEELARPEVAAYLEVRAREETGHDRLALKDLRAMGCLASVSSPISCREASSRCATGSMTFVRGSIRSAALGIRTASSASPRSSSRATSRRCRCSALVASMRPDSSEVTAASEAKSHTSRRQSSLWRPFPQMTVSVSFRRRMSRH